MKKGKTSWIKDLKKSGYLYMVSINGKSVWATKSNQLESGEFDSDGIFNEFTLEDGESWPKNKSLKKFYFIGELNG